MSHRAARPPKQQGLGFSRRAARLQSGAEGFADQVRQLWAERHGLPVPWPKERRHDAIGIGQAIRRYHLPLDFWSALFEAVPQGATFRYLRQRGPQSGMSRLDEAAEQWKKVWNPTVVTIDEEHRHTPAQLEQLQQIGAFKMRRIE